MEPTTPPAAGGSQEPERRPPFARRITGGVRTRILASYIILLAIAAFASVLAVRQVLLVRLDDRIEEDLQQEVEEFRALAGGNDPETGRPFGNDVKQIFNVYLDRNVPDDDEELITVPREGEAERDGGDNTQSFTFGDFVERWRTLEEVERADVDTPGGPVRYVAIPVRSENGTTLGTFVVASFVADERQEVDEAVRIVALVSAAVLILGSIVAFSIVGRVLAPLSGLRDAAASVSGTQMDQRIEVDSDDEIAQLAGTFNRMLDRLQIAFASQREFIRDVSHELRTPIAVSRGHLELLSEGHLSDPNDRREAIALVTGELDRMSRFVDDLLLLAKAESPNFLELETVPLSELCEELIAKVRGIADRNWQLDSVSHRSIVADRQRLTQAVMNLAQNAVVHTEVDDVIAIGSKASETEARIWVRDSGTGIPASEQARIFQRFSRGLHSRGRYEGTGIGLAIVRAIAEAHGGRVSVESEPGQGSRFEIVIPVEQEDPEQAWRMEVGA